MTTFLHWVHSVAAHRYFRVFVFAQFVAQALFLVFAMNVGTPPDENNHIEFVEFYAEHSVTPVFDEQTPTWSLGDKTREPDYLYHYAGSMVARAIPGETTDVYALRIITVLTACATFLVLIKILRRLNLDDAPIHVGLLIFTNIPMVLMVSAAVNNDVAVWLATVLGVWFVLKLCQQPTILNLLLLSSVAAYGGLIKRTLFPVALALMVIAAVLVLRRWKTFTASFKHPDWKIIAATVVLVIGVGLVAERVGGNMIRYGTIVPDCEQVQGEEACEVFWASARQRWIDSGAPTPSKWLSDGTTIDETLMPLPIFVVKWAATSAYNVVDIQTQGWRHAVMPPVWFVSGLFALFSGALVYGLVDDIRRIRRDTVALQRLFVIMIAGVIVAAQLAVNYASYRSEHIFGLALNGRYIVPALLLLVGLACFYGSKMLGRRASTVVAIVVVLAVVVWSGLALIVRNPQTFTG